MSWQIADVVDQGVLITWRMVNEKCEVAILCFMAASRVWQQDTMRPPSVTTEELIAALPEKHRALAMQRSIEARRE